MKAQAVFEMMVSLVLSLFAALLVLYLLAGVRNNPYLAISSGATGTEGNKTLALERLCGCYPAG